MVVLKNDSQDADSRFNNHIIFNLMEYLSKNGGEGGHVRLKL